MRSQAMTPCIAQGNLCRCTGYKKIIESILAAAKKMKLSVSPNAKSSRRQSR